MAKAHGFGGADGSPGVIEVLRGRMEDIELPEKVDVIVSEWMARVDDPVRHLRARPVAQARGRHVPLLGAAAAREPAGPQPHLQPPAPSSLQPPASSLKPQASSLKPQASSRKPQASTNPIPNPNPNPNLQDKRFIEERELDSQDALRTWDASAEEMQACT
eukprot:scaffold3179_cov59-Phaeocystis_antarctica.AAC.2